MKTYTEIKRDTKFQEDGWNRILNSVTENIHNAYFISSEDAIGYRKNIDMLKKDHDPSWDPESEKFEQIGPLEIIVSEKEKKHYKHKKKYNSIFQ